MLTISFSDIYASSISEILIYDNPRMLRIVLKTHGDISYKILPNKEASKVTVVFENAIELSPIALSTLQPVKKMSKIETTQDEKGGIISLQFLLNSSFYNVKSFPLFSPPSIIIDIAETAPEERFSSSMDSAEKEDSSGQDVNKLTKARPDLQNLLLPKSSVSTKGIPDIDLFPSDLLDLKDGVVRAVYKDYMKRKFDKIFKDGKTFLKRHSNAHAADEVAFLIAESRYLRQKEKAEINLLPTVEAFHYAIEQYPDSSFVSYGYFMIGKCYYEMGWMEEVLPNTRKALDRSEPDACHLSVLNYYHAHALAEAKKYNAAVAALLDLLDDPTLSNLSSEIKYRLATVYAGKGEWEKSYDIFEDAINDERDRMITRPDLQLIYAKVMLHLDILKEAKSTLHYLLKEFGESPESLEAVLLLGDCYRVEGNDNLALWNYYKVIQVKRDSIGGCLAQIRTARLSLDHKKKKDIVPPVKLSAYTQPIATLKDIVLYSNSETVVSEACFELSRFYHDEGASDEAVKWALDGVKADPEGELSGQLSEIIRSNISKAVSLLFSKEKYLDCLTWESLAREIINPPVRSLEIDYALGRAAKQLGFDSISEEMFTKILRRTAIYHPSEEITYATVLGLAHALIKRSKIQEAHNVLVKNLPDKWRESQWSGKAHWLLGICEAGFSHHEKAIALYQKSLHTSTRNTTETIHIKMDKAQSHFTLDDKENAIREVLEALKRFDTTGLTYQDSPLARNILLDLGYYYFSAGDYTSAKNVYNEFLDIYPEDVERQMVLFALGRCAFHLKGWTSAEQHFKKLSTGEERAETFWESTTANSLKEIDWHSKYASVLY